MRAVYRTVCNWIFSVTKSLINWCINHKRWKWAAKIVSMRTQLAETTLHHIYPPSYSPHNNTSDLMLIIAEKTDDPIVIQNMEITASNAFHKRKRIRRSVVA